MPRVLRPVHGTAQIGPLVIGLSWIFSVLPKHLVLLPHWTSESMLHSTWNTYSPNLAGFHSNPRALASAAPQMQISHLCCVCLCPVVLSITTFFPYCSRVVPHHTAVSVRMESCRLLVSSLHWPHCRMCFSIAFGIFNEWMSPFLRKQTKLFLTFSFMIEVVSVMRMKDFELENWKSIWQMCIWS